MTHANHTAAGFALQLKALLIDCMIIFLPIYIGFYQVNIPVEALVEMIAPVAGEAGKESGLLAPSKVEALEASGASNTTMVGEHIRLFFLALILNYIILFSSFIITFVYELIFTLSPWKGTIGMHIMGLRVGKKNGDKAGIFRSIVRALIAWTSRISIIGFALIALRKDRRGLHDILSCTTVYVDSRA